MDVLGPGPGIGSKRARTRARLIEAASELIGEKGFEATTLEEVARRAGVTRGSIYGNFRDRDELFLAVAEQLWSPVAPSVPAGASRKELLRELGIAVARAARDRRPRAVGAASFQVYALTHPEMRARLAAANQEIYRWAEREMTSALKPEELPPNPSEFVKLLHALTEGLMSLHFLTPELITEDVIVAAFEALA